MLVLSRKKGERIFIGNNIVLTILDIDRGKVRIGIDAPKDMNIVRSELSWRNGDENATSSNTRDNKETGDDIFGKSTEVS